MLRKNTLKIDKYLTQGEIVDKTFSLNGFDVHATNKRLFISSFDGNTVADYDYNHVSSLVFSVKKYRWLIVVGAAILAGSLLFMNGAPSILRNVPLIWAAVAAGMACIVVGIFKKKEYMKIFVLGTNSPELSGKRANLDNLFRTIREKKEVPIMPTSI